MLYTTYEYKYSERRVVGPTRLSTPYEGSQQTKMFIRRSIIFAKSVGNAPSEIWRQIRGAEDLSNDIRNL